MCVKGIKLHKKDCPNAISMQSNYAYRIIQAKWIDSSQEEFKAILKIDIEGFEPYALSQAEKLFDQLDFQIIFME